MDTQKILCLDCKSTLSSSTEVCPFCNSTKKEINITFKDGITVHESISVKKIDAKMTGRKKIREKYFEGHDQSVNGDWVSKKQIISTEKDYYFEQIIDSNGEVIHKCEEPLSKHRNRGSAKFKKL